MNLKIFLSVCFMLACSPSLAQDAQYDSTAAQGEQSYSTNTTNTSVSSSEDVEGSPQLSRAAYSLLAPNSVNSSAFSSGDFSYGFPVTSVQFNSNQYSSLPTVSTSSIDLNVVDLPFLRSGAGSTQSVVSSVVNSLSAGVTQSTTTNTYQSVSQFFGQ